MKGPNYMPPDERYTQRKGYIGLATGGNYSSQILTYGGISMKNDYRKSCGC